MDHTGGSSTRMGNLSSAFEKADSQWEQMFKCRLERWQQTPKNNISPSMFHLNDMGNGNGDISSDEHYKNMETKRGSQLLLEMFIV
jgi:hypothetical protein